MMLRLPGFLLVVALPLVCGGTTADDPKSLKLLDGTPKVLVVHGYSTSFHWPQILQRKLDRYFDGKRIIEVQSAIKGGTPIAKWMNVESGERSTGSIPGDGSGNRAV